MGGFDRCRKREGGVVANCEMCTFGSGFVVYGGGSLCGGGGAEVRGRP